MPLMAVTWERVPRRSRPLGICLGKGVTHVARELFEAGQAVCGTCGAPVSRELSMSKVIAREVFGPDATAVWCALCEDSTYFVLS